jgi:cysteinyl-tRNA synthetase, unknown class
MSAAVFKWLRRAVAIAAIAGGLYWMHVTPEPRTPVTGREGPALAAAQSWGYQLQAPVRRLIPDEIDVLVIDYAFDGADQSAFAPADLELFRRRTDGRPRIVLAYMSVGEAETYRFYWWRAWRFIAPRWLAHENPKWKGNYVVRYWEQGWQRVLFNAVPSRLDRLIETAADWWKPYLDRVIEAGFDGVYLDRVDACDDWEQQRRTAQDDMVALVKQLSATAKARRPGFLVVAQNGEELLEKPGYLEALDGVAKEDTLFGIDGAEKPNEASDVARTVELLKLARQAGKPVFTVEYLKDPAKRAQARAAMVKHGFILHFAERELKMTPEHLPPPAPLNGTPPRR